MGVFKSNTFKDFFDSKFFAERAYMKFNPRHFERVYYKEMAMPGVGEHMGDVPKHPMNIDKEDIAFLKQFPPAVWRPALRQRFELLHDALLKLHDKRMEMGFKELEQNIKSAMLAGWKGDSSGWDALQNSLDPSVIDRLKRDFTPEAIQREFGRDERKIHKFIADESHKEAYEEIKSKSEGIEESPEPVEFKFKSGTYYAKPFLNRLYHKMERTEGTPHDSSAGLNDFGISHGKYGYDLGFPKNNSLEEKSKRTTRGLGSWPDSPTVNKHISELWNLNQHHVFGDLEIPDGAVWKKIKGDNGRGLKDYHLWNQAEDKNYKRIVADLMREEQAAAGRKFRTMDQLTAQARIMAHEATLKDAEEGKLIAPPVPGVDPESRKVRVVNGKEVLPDVYLPHVKTKIKTKNKDGQIVDVDDWVPVVNPSHFFRELGKEETDYLHDDEDRRTGEFDLENLKDRMVGHPDEKGLKPYVRVEPHEYVKTGDMGHQAQASFHLNQNSKGRYFVSRGDPQYAEYYNMVFGDMELKTYKDQNGAQMWDDFRDGIMRCLASTRCGGAGQEERMAVLMQLPSIHGIVVTQAENNLRNPKLHTEAGRKSFAENLIISFVQTNLGQGTRRQRILDKNAKDVSRDKTTTGSEGGDVGIEDELDKHSRDKNDFGQTAGRGRGGRLVGASNWIDAGGNTNYNVDEFRQAIEKIEAEAKMADKESDYAIGSDDINSLKDSTLDKANVIAAIKNHLIGLAIHTGRDVSSIEKDIEDEIKGWIEDGATTSMQLVSKFESHPFVVAKVGQPAMAQGQNQDQTQAPEVAKERKPPTPEVLDAIETLKNDPSFKRIKDLQNKGTWDQVKAGAIAHMKLLPLDGEKYSKFISNFADTHLELDPAHMEDSLEMLQDFLDDELKIGSPTKIEPDTAPRPVSQMPTAPASVQNAPALAARQIATTDIKPGWVRNLSHNDPLHTVKEQKRWMDFIHHPHFLAFAKTANPNQFPKLLEKLNQWKASGNINDAEYNEAKAKLDAGQQTAAQHQANNPN